MPEDLVRRYEELKERKQELVNKKTKKETQLEQVREDYKDKLRKIKDQFDVNSLEDAEELKDTLEEDIENLVPELENKLSEYEDDLDVR